MLLQNMYPFKDEPLTKEMNRARAYDNLLRNNHDPKVIGHNSHDSILF